MQLEDLERVQERLEHDKRERALWEQELEERLQNETSRMQTNFVE